MKLIGDAAKALADDVRAHNEQRRGERLARAKADAVSRGKEPFDLEKLESLCDTSNAGKMAPLDERFAEFEREYYVVFPNVMTLEEFAKKIEELSRW